MRLTTVLLIASLVQVSAAGFAQKLTFNKKGTTLSEVFREIKVQTGYNIYYQKDQVKSTAKIDVDFKDEDLKVVLDQLASRNSFEYQIDNRNISIKVKTPSFLDRIIDRFAAIDVRGVVVDGETGLGLAGASVKVKGTSRATTTGSNGEFYLRGVDEDAVIDISFVGFKSVELKAAKDLGTIKMEVSFSDLQEVEINKGYYTEKRKLSTGSVGRVTAEEIGRQPVSNPLAALYGKIPGVVITQTTGIPGGGFNIQIRGENSLRRTGNTNGNTPLYVIDGVPFNPIPLNVMGNGNLYPSGDGLVGASPLNSINPADIESVDILKDADATAIYGSRGSNGVVLVTTKKGVAGQMKIDVLASTGAGMITRRMKMLNTEEYLQMRKEAYKNDGVTTYPVNAYDVNGTWDQNKYTDWQKELVGGTAKSTDVQISSSGGSINSQYRIGGGFHRETTVFPGDFDDKRGSIQFSLVNSSTNQKFKSQLSINYSIGNTNLLQQDLTPIALTYAPNAPDLLTVDGNLNWPTGITANPLQYIKKPYDSKTANLISNLILSYKFFPNLMLMLNAGYTNSDRKEIYKSPISSQRPIASAQNTSRFGGNFTNGWIIEPQLNWSKDLTKHHIDVMLGINFSNQTQESLLQTASGFTSENLMDNISFAPAGNITSEVTASNYKYSAVYSRVNYNYDEKYVINITGRRDGSSRFGPGKQFGNFGAVAPAWIFSKEAFLNTNKIISYGKLRGSFGLAGNDRIPDYQFLDLYTTGNSYDGLVGLAPQQLYNPDLKWEETRKLELALELGFLNDKILLTTAWYRNRSSNQLARYALPPTAAFTGIQSNIAATVQNTGLEIEINGKLLKKNGFQWDASLNLNFPKNKLLSFENLETSSYANTYVVGQPLQILKLFEFTGVDPATGLYQFKDLDNNGIYNSIDQYVVKSFAPKLYAGVTNNFQWKGFRLDLLFQFVKQNGRNYLGITANAPGFQNTNQPKDVMGRWQDPGNVTNIQRFSSGVTGSLGANEYSRLKQSDVYISDASFIRLKNLSLSYSISPSILKKIRIQTIRLYTQGQNLLTITNYKGLDPESQGTTLPPLRFITGGFQLTF